ncbi:hypothetical protein RUND412_010416 [Rhizina undulata]
MPAAERTFRSPATGRETVSEAGDLCTTALIAKVKRQYGASVERTFCAPATGYETPSESRAPRTGSETISEAWHTMPTEKRDSRTVPATMREALGEAKA